MELEARRPRPAEYRNAVRALSLALGALFADPLAVRRAVRAALEGAGLNRVVLALRSAPATFGTPRPVDPRMRELADEALAAFAQCRERCTRPLIREAADLLRPGVAQHRGDRERRAAREAAWNASEALRNAENLRKEFAYIQNRWRGNAAYIYWNPDAAMRAAANFGRVHGHTTLSEVIQKHPTRFGWMRWWPFVYLWRGRLETRRIGYATHAVRDFARDAARLVEMFSRVADRARLAELQAQADATAAAVAALGPEPPDRDLWKAPRRASGPILDAMRLLSPRHPEDAAPEVRRQLAAMLPADADTLIDRAIQLAQQQDRDEQRRGLVVALPRGRR
jgi:hypothetical protein